MEGRGRWESERIRPSAPALFGRVAEWFKAHAWRACGRRKRLVGSNPTPSVGIAGGGAGSVGVVGLVSLRLAPWTGNLPWPGRVALGTTLDEAGRRLPARHRRRLIGALSMMLISGEMRPLTDH